MSYHIHWHTLGIWLAAISIGVMDSHDLTPQQLDHIAQRVRRMLGYLHRLKGRMESEAFAVDDELYRLVAAAEDAMHRLSVNVHYRACGK